MTGRVFREKRGILAVETDAGDFSIFDFAGGERERPRRNDRVEWPEGETGPVTLRNLTQEESYEVIAVDHGVPRDEVPARLLD